VQQQISPLIDEPQDEFDDLPIETVAMEEPEVPQEIPEPEEKIPFYRRVLAHHGNDDPGGFGPNWSGVDDFDIPTVLRKNMD
jgi:hypothetical protein